MGHTVEINGNLDGKDGLSNYNEFSNVINKVLEFYSSYFDANIMSAIDLYIDNATENSGYTPITTPILWKYLIIKLGIDEFSRAEKIAFQFAHELMHYVYYSKYGLKKQKAGEKEESVCTAASLIILHDLYPESFNEYNNYVKSLSDEGYRKGVEVAKSVDYKLDNLEKLI